MRIAPQHISGTPENSLSRLLGVETQYQPTCPWPDDCMVQWGHGLAPAVPFFEAFPAGTFIRGEGETIVEAEQKAFEKYQRDIACSHVWGRHRPGTKMTYTNGAAFCRKCGGFRSGMFPELKPSGWWRKPLTMSEVWLLESYEQDHELSAIMDAKYPDDREKRKKFERILRLRLNLFGVEPRAYDSEANNAPDSV